MKMNLTHMHGECFSWYSLNSACNLTMQNGVCVNMTDENLSSDDYPANCSQMKREELNMDMNFV
jgi:hypothetical protein